MRSTEGITEVNWTIGVEYSEPKQGDDLEAENAVVVLTREIENDNTDGLAVEDALYIDAMNRVGRAPKMDPKIVSELNRAMALKQAEFGQTQGQEDKKVKTVPDMEVSYNPKFGRLEVRISGLDPAEAEAFKQQLEEDRDRSVESQRDHGQEKGLLGKLNGLFKTPGNPNNVSHLIDQVLAELKKDVDQLKERSEEKEKEKNPEIQKDLNFERIVEPKSSVSELSDRQKKRSGSVSDGLEVQPRKEMPTMGAQLNFMEISNSEKMSRLTKPSAAIDGLGVGPGPAAALVVRKGDLEPTTADHAASDFASKKLVTQQQQL